MIDTNKWYKIKQKANIERNQSNSKNSINACSFQIRVLQNLTTFILYPIKSN